MHCSSDVGQVGGAIVGLRCRQAQQHEVGSSDDLGDVVVKRKPFLDKVGPNKICEARLEDADLSLQECFDLCAVDIDTRHTMAEFGKARACCQTDVPCSDDDHI